ncbi:hypothetical protein LCGC14_0568890 [marine sediment metagenome]|uniref:Uncharacterized protein n=1 Tax=marine sediment metagenome TaxID=412755 RepID=A0A0F9UT61_9ZZZZ|nr:hypothetical protein [Phycisphaerae bacterium]
MAIPVPIFARIISPDPVVIGPAEWTYTLEEETEFGVHPLPGVVPVDERPPLEIDARSVAPGTGVRGFRWSDGREVWFFHEQPAFAPCEPGGGDAAVPPAAPGGAEGSGVGLGGDSGTAGAE